MTVGSPLSLQEERELLKREKYVHTRNDSTYSDMKIDLSFYEFKEWKKWQVFDL